MSETMKDQIAVHQRVVSAAVEQVSHLERIADRLIEIFKLHGRVYVVGNGGSAADAQHIAAELVGRFKQDRRPLPAIALTTDSSVLTAVSNDLGAERPGLLQARPLLPHGPGPAPGPRQPLHYPAPALRHG